MPAGESTSKKGIIAWFASNHVAANLLMLIIIFAGLLSAATIRKQTLPDFETNTIQVSVPYLGAAPQEVEEAIVIKIEEAVQDIDGIEEIRSTAAEGVGTVSIEVLPDEDLQAILNEVKTRVDAISTFPALAERPVITKREFQQQVLFLALYGDLDPFSRKLLGQEIRDELVRIPEVASVRFLGDRDFEISIEVSEKDLLQYGLTITDVSEAVRASSVDLPGGSINTRGGDVLLRTTGQVYTGVEFADLVLRTFPDGTRLTIGDVATVKDGFVEDDRIGRFNSRETATLEVLTNKRQNELTTSEFVQDYVERKRAELPDGVELTIWADRSPFLQGRLNLMLKNMFFGALLVLLMLSLFLRMKIAGWVIIGIPVSFLGALWLMPFAPWPVTINMISLFGFIMVLGIVVDDAIIIGESIYTQIRKDGHSLDSVVQGANRVAVPATFGVLTTIAVFAPMLFIGGFGGPFFEAMSTVVIICLIFSLVESKLILPAHLVRSHIPDIDEDDLFRPQRRIPLRERLPRFFTKINRHVQHGLHRFIDTVYKPILSRAVEARGVTVALFVAGLVLSLGLVGSGTVRVVIFPEVAGEFIQVNMDMRDGTPTEVRNEAILRVERALLALDEEYNAERPGEPPLIRFIGTYGTGKTSGLLVVQLPSDVERDTDARDIIERWRERIGEIAGLRQIDFSFGFPLGGGAPIGLKLSGDNFDALEDAAAELEQKLAEYDGVFDIVNSSASGAQEIELSIKPEAEALGLTMATLGRQVRQAFYGEEAQRIQRGKNEIKVMVRYPEEDRRSVQDLEDMRIRTASGSEVPFRDVAEIRFGTSYSSIQRIDRSRTVTVSADIDPDRVQPQEVIADLRQDFVPELLARYPGVRFGLEGASQEEGEFLANLGIASIVALFLIYGLIAIPLKSYSQPLVIMAVIPFGAIGAIIGHILLGKAISMFSLFGLVALAGVVVNDSLIMVDFVNKARADGVPLREAVVESGAQRFRAIILTSVTTAAGLMPIILETSTQAQFVIPMAISISFGILFATVITLVLVPCLVVLQQDFFARMRWLWDLLLGRPEQRGASDIA